MKQAPKDEALAFGSSQAIKLIPSDRVSLLLDAIKPLIEQLNYHAPNGVTEVELRFRKKLVNVAYKLESEFGI